MGTKNRRAFTMIELLGVMTIISILVVFILVAASGAQRDAQREATRGTIRKIEDGLNTLLQSIESSRQSPSLVHQQWAASYQPANGQVVGSFNDRGVLQRASVLAHYDELRAEMPDTFFFQDVSLNQSTYPVNFAGQAFVSGFNQPHLDYVLPIGSNWIQLNDQSTWRGQPPAPQVTPGTGIYGASYGAASGLLKNLGNVPGTLLPGAQGMLPQGSDGADNDNDGYIDNIGEGLGGNPGNPTIRQSVAMSLSQHKHVTARSEMLYALLVEGQGPYGASLLRENFTDKEVKDTDNDGLPEFVDGWGNPFQFFRWPIYYPSDVQKGLPRDPATGLATAPYTGGVFVPREQDSLDPNQQLMSVNWWSSAGNSGPANPSNPTNASFLQSSSFLSGGALSFQFYFHSIVEPLSYQGANPTQFWDRSPTFFQRRAFYTRFLVLSGGPDGIPGVPILPDAQIANLLASAGGASSVSFALQLEGQAAPYDLVNRLNAINLVNDFSTTNPPNPGDTPNGDGFSPPPRFFDEGLDDITNHNLNSTAQVSAQ